MKSGTTRNRLLIFAFMLFIGADAIANTITLRTSVRLSHESDEIRLRDIAELNGDEAQQFADVLIGVVDDAESVLEIPLRQVRLALDGAGIHWGRVHLNGRKVLVRPRNRSNASTPLAMTAVSVDIADAAGDSQRTADRREPMLASQLSDEATLRGAIAEYLTLNLNVDADHLRLDFDDRDADLLDTSLDIHRFEIEPASSLRSNRIDLGIRIWKDGAARERQTVRVTPTLYMPIVLLRRDVDRGAVLTEDDVEIEHQWMSPVHGGLVTDERDAVGRIATIRLSEGDALREQHVKRETLIRRGDLVIVRALIGGSVISLQAEARATGSEGDTIEFRKLGERDTFLATVAGRNEAVIDLQR